MSDEEDYLASSDKLRARLSWLCKLCIVQHLSRCPCQKTKCWLWKSCSVVNYLKKLTHSITAGCLTAHACFAWLLNTSLSICMFSSKMMHCYSCSKMHVSNMMLQQITMSPFLCNRMLQQVAAVLCFNMTSYIQHAVMLPHKYHMVQDQLSVQHAITQFFEWVHDQLSEQSAIAWSCNWYILQEQDSVGWHTAGMAAELCPGLWCPSCSACGAAPTTKWALLSMICDTVRSSVTL